MGVPNTPWAENERKKPWLNRVKTFDIDFCGMLESVDVTIAPPSGKAEIKAHGVRASFDMQ